MFRCTFTLRGFCGFNLLTAYFLPCSQIIKYGVISTDSLIDDLIHWKTMYVAGRLHKPVGIQIGLLLNPQTNYADYFTFIKIIIVMCNLKWDARV